VVDFTTFVFNPNTRDTTLVLAVGVPF